MSKILSKLKKEFKQYQICRMAFFNTAFQYQEELEADGKTFREEILKVIPQFPTMEYLKFKPLCKLLPESFIKKLSDDGAAKLHYYSSRSWFVEACAEIVKKRAYDYRSIDDITSRYAKENRGSSRVREPSNTDVGLLKQLEQRDLKIAELEHELKIVRAENTKLRAENLKLRSLKKRKSEIKKKFASARV